MTPPPQDLPADARGAALRTLLLGTHSALDQLQRQLELAQVPLEVVGCVLTDIAADSASASDAPPAPLLGHLDDLAQILDEHRPDRVLVSLPAVMIETIGLAARSLNACGASWAFVPTLADQLAGRVAPPAAEATPPAQPPPPHADHMLSIRPAPAGAHLVDPIQLIGRRPHPLDDQAIRRTLTDRVVLITGAGGSIGSELARIVARYQPRRLVLVERSENALFEVDRLIGRLFADLPRAAVLHDVAHAQRTLAVVTAQKPHIIFHAAAHKHVPMMEDHPDEAVENNFYGTRAIADAAAANAVDRFVMISSDKAVNPSSVMGATKRLAEL